MKKIFTYRGKTLQELQQLSHKEFAQLLPARQRRSLTRGLSDKQKKVLDKLNHGKKVKTHCRNMIVFPEMVDKLIMIYSGKEFVAITIQNHMIGHRLGEFALTRKRVSHSSPGIGATRSSSALSVR